LTAEFLPPTSRDVLPGRPAPFFLAAGEGERAHLFDQLFTVLLSGDETEGQFGVFTMEAPQGRAIPVHAHDDVHEIFFVLDGRVRVAIEEGGEVHDRVLTSGDFGYVPAGLKHSFRVESHRARTLGVSTGGFERFFAAAGEPTAATMPPAVPVIPSPEQLGEAARRFRNEFHHDVRLID
jgi:quercetin 2,3-dioxygenase